MSAKHPIQITHEEAESLVTKSVIDMIASRSAALQLALSSATLLVALRREVPAELQEEINESARQVVTDALILIHLAHIDIGSLDQLRAHIAEESDKLVDGLMQ